MKRRFDEDGFKHTYGHEWLRVSSMNCCVCGQRGWWAHHVKTVKTGGRDMDNCVPLCVTHHTDVENIGRGTFERRHGIKLQAVAEQAGVRSPYRERETRLNSLGEIRRFTSE